VKTLPDLPEDMTFAFRIYLNDMWLTGFKVNRLGRNKYTVHVLGLTRVLNMLKNVVGAVIDDVLKDFEFKQDGEYYYFNKQELEDLVNRLEKAGLSVEVVLLYEWSKRGA